MVWETLWNMAFVESTSKMFVFWAQSVVDKVFSLPGVGANCDQKAMVSRGCSKKFWFWSYQFDIPEKE